MTIKTRAALYPRVEAAIRASHPYELPEIVAVPLAMDCAPTSTGSRPKPLRPTLVSRRRRAAIAATARVPFPWAWRRTSRPRRRAPAPEQAFHFSALRAGRPDARGAVSSSPMATTFIATSSDSQSRRKARSWACPDLPAGKIKTDEILRQRWRPTAGRWSSNYRCPAPTAGQSVVLAADSQGCADAGSLLPAHARS